MWYVRDVLYAVLYVRVSCFVVRGCGVSRRYIDVCYCDMFSVVNVYHDHLKFCVVYINSRRYVGCSECDVVFNECNNNNNNCLKSNIQCIEIRVQWTVYLGSSHMHVHAVTRVHAVTPKLVICVMYLTSI